MTNRQMLLNTSIYDTLVKANMGLQIKSDRLCILDAFEKDVSDICMGVKCDECISRWLNKEYNYDGR